MKKNDKNLYTIQLNDDMSNFVKETAEKRCITASALIKYALGEYRENYEKQQIKS